MEKNDIKYQAYVQILREELIPAMGCTEPIALAYAAAVTTGIIAGNANRELGRGLHTYLTEIIRMMTEC